MHTLKKMRNTSIIVILVLAFIVILQNSATIQLNFLFWRLSISELLLLPVTLILGFILGWLSQFRPKRKAKTGDYIASALQAGNYAD